MTPDRRVKIAKRAYAIWELEGGPSGRELDHWLREAEFETQGTETSKMPPKAPVKARRPTSRRARQTA